jgi:hypothetical protein
LAGMAVYWLISQLLLSQMHQQPHLHLP